MSHFNTLKNLFIILGLSLLFSAAGCRKTEDLSLLGNNITCYAAAYNKGVYKSENGGISWYPLAPDQDDIYFYSKRLFFSPDAKKLYVATAGNGLYYIDMEKDILNRVNYSKDEDVASVVFKDSTNGQLKGFEILIGEREEGIFRSTERLDNWEQLNHGLTYRDVNVLINSSGNILAGTINGIFKWDEASKAWRDSSEGIKNKNIISLSSNPDGSTLYAGAGVYQFTKGRFENIPCLYKSTDKGGKWVDSGPGLPKGVLVFSIAVNPLNTERIYLGTSDGIYRSTDSGRKWSKMDGGLPDAFKVLDIMIVRLSEGKDMIYAAGVNGLFAAFDVKNPKWESRSYGFEETYISDIVLQSN